VRYFEIQAMVNQENKACNHEKYGVISHIFLMTEIINILKKHGEQMDIDIATATGNSLANVRLQLSELASRGEVTFCQSIRFENGNKIERFIYRLSGYLPPASQLRNRMFS
jgi:transcription initiation factor IIE alpha subunit